jgi:hypothetical protein
MEQDIKEIPSDLEDLFGGDTIINLDVKGRVVRFTLREKDSETDLEYQRRLADRNRDRTGNFEASGRALQAELWLFGKLCKKVEVKEGDGWKDATDFKERLTPDYKRMVLFEYNQRVGRHVEQTKN